MDPYTKYAETIESALTHACRAHRLAPDAADEFASWARVRLLDNDQAILRKFEGRSKVRTFLVTVIQRLYLDWRNAEWGKWRPSAEARRVGAVAIELERLVLRDQHTFEEAVQTLAARELATPDECERAWVKLPRRPRRQRVDEEDMGALPAATTASESVDRYETRAQARAVVDALSRAIKTLPPADQLLVQLHFWGGQTVARIAIVTGENQKGLYRRLDKVKAELRRRLESDGLRGDMLADLEGHVEAPDSDFAGSADGADRNLAGMGTVTTRPSTERSTGGEHV